MQNTWSQINYNNFSCTSIPFKFSSAIGDSSHATGYTSFASGSYVFANGDGSHALGNNSYAKGYHSFAIGNGVNAEAYNSFILGVGLCNFSKNEKCAPHLFTTNNIENSFMVVFNTPKLFVSQYVGVNTAKPGSQLQVDGNCAIGYNDSMIAPNNGLLVNGNVGIGTNSLPTEKLEVNGGIRLQTMTPGSSENGTILWNGTDLLYRKNSNWQSISYSSPWDTNFTSVTTNKNVGIGVSNAGEKLEVNGALNLHAKEPLLAADGTIVWSGVDFLGRKNGTWVSLTSTGTTSNEWITTSKGIYTNSIRVGINTIPDAMLHLKSSSNNGHEKPVSPSIRLETVINDMQVPIITDIINASDGFKIKHQNKEVFIINNSTAILNNQLVINRPNTTDPDIIIAKQGETNNPCIRLENSYNSGGGGTIPDDAIITNSYNIALAKGALKIQANTATGVNDIISFSNNYVTIPSQYTSIAGNVGIGVPPTLQVKFKVGGNASFSGNIGIGETGSPSRLHIKGNNTDITLENTNNTPPNESSKVIIRAANGAGRIISDKDFAVFIDSDDNQTNEGFYVMSNSSYWGGNAVNLLQVKSEGTTINATGTGLTVNTTNGAWGYNIISNVINNDTKAFVVQNGGTDKLIVYGNGNVTIGENIKLYDDGRIWAKKILIKNVEQWPDYVFKEAYPLITIKNLEDSIKTYGKLPDFPTAKEIETDGMQVEQIIPLLVKKIEEQSLYIITLNNEIEALKKAIK